MTRASVVLWYSISRITGAASHERLARHILADILRYAVHTELRGAGGLHADICDAEPMRLTAAELMEILAAGEGKTTEFKRGLQRDATIARTLAAFGNTRGGLLFVGVGDRGEIVGAPHPAETMQRLVQIAHSHVAPAIALEVTAFEVTTRAPTTSAREERKTIVCCSVPLSPARPHSALDDEQRGNVYVRNGSSNRVARPAAIAAMRPQPSVPLDELETRVLEWIDDARRTCEGTALEFARAKRVGIQRVRHAFVALERAGLLIGHGRDDKRVFARPG